MVTIPRLVRTVAIKGVFRIGAVAGILSPLFLSVPSLPMLLAGMLMQVCAVAGLELAMSLYLMKLVPKRELAHFEPIRIICSGTPFFIGPWAGVYLENHVAHWMPFALTSGTAGLALVYARFLGLWHPSAQTASTGSVNPVRYLHRFVAQPRMRLAWTIAFGRYAWWQIFLVYTPIYAVHSGLSEVIGGVIVSTGMAFIFLVPVWAWLGRRYGLRRLFVVMFLVTGLVTPLVAVVSGWSAWAGPAVLIIAALFASVVDGGGHIPFYRAVRPLERSEMAGVYLTHRDVGQLLPPGIIAVLLSFYALPVVFVMSGLGMLVVAYFSRHLPRRL